MPLGSNLSNNIKELRTALGQSQDWLARAIDVSRATINRWETKGAGNVTLDELELLAAKLESTPGDLTGIAPTSPTIASLTRTIKEQERRIQELEPQPSLSPARRALLEVLAPLDEAQVAELLPDLRGYVAARIGSDGKQSAKKAK